MFDYELDYQLLDWDEKPKEVKQEKNACPKCGKELPQKGAHWHVKRCEGLNNGN